MKDFESMQRELNENPEKKAEYDKLECKTFAEKFTEIQPFLLRRSSIEVKKKKRQKLWAQIISAASIVLIIGISLGLYFGLSTKDNTPPIEPIEYLYEDEYIIAKNFTENELMEITNLYLPSLSILSEKSFRVGEHIETHESVYFFIYGIHEGEEYYREIRMTIIIQKQYKINNEADYNTGNTISIANKTISVFESFFDDPFYSYKLGFSFNNVRYCLDYQTITQDDYQIFLELFLK